MGKTYAYTMSDVQGHMQDGVRCLLGLYAQATSSELRSGLNWYADAHNDCVKLARRYGLPLDLVVKVAAVLSPQVNWDSNIPCAEEVIRYYLAGQYVPDIRMWKRFGGELPLGPCKDHYFGISSDAMFDHPAIAYRTNQVKALWLLQGHDQDLILQGPKVRAFIDNILHHDSSDAVTVDSHAIQAWFGNITPGTYGVPDKAYGIIVADYRQAAEVVGVSPLQFQAVVWLVKKRLQDAGPESDA